MERSVRHKREQLVHVDATLAILDPDVDPEAIPKKRPKHVNLFRQGELSRLIMTVFREADGQALSTPEITKQLMQTQGLPGEARSVISRRVRTSLAHQSKRGKVTKQGAGREAQWRLVGSN